MARAFTALVVFHLFVLGCVLLGSHLLHRRWDRKGFYE